MNPTRKQFAVTARRVKSGFLQVFVPLAPALAWLCLTAHSYGALSEQRVHSFGVSAGDGRQCFAGLTQGSDGVFYGTTYRGGSNDAGTVFKLNPNGTGYTLLHNFLTNGVDGQNPAVGGNLLLGRDGVLYGMTVNGGANGTGTIFKLNTSGTGYGLIRTSEAAGSELDLTNPSPELIGSLIQGSDDLLYGVSRGRSPHDSGRVFKLDTNGLGYTEIHVFDVNTNGGGHPGAGLVQGRDGMLYGTTQDGDGFYGSTNCVFKLNTNGASFLVLHAFTGPGSVPATNSDGYYSRAPLLLGNDGMLYGTTWEGGYPTMYNVYGYGTVFKLNPANGANYEVIHIFTVNNTNGFVNIDGVYPLAGLMQGNDGTLYGTTSGGGVDSADGGGGVVFKLNTDGTGYRVIHDFNVPAFGGFDPEAGLIIGKDGAFYGTTARGGEATDAGTVFKLGGDFTRLNSFGANSMDGARPQAPLIQTGDGTLYGTTQSGGSNGGFGTVYKLNPNLTGYGVIYSFSKSTNGDFPVAGLSQGYDGALYGAALAGGNGLNATPFGGSGTLFKLNGNGTGFAPVYIFMTNGIDGRNPVRAPRCQAMTASSMGPLQAAEPTTPAPCSR